jgi:hypothetical protein
MIARNLRRDAATLRALATASQTLQRSMIARADKRLVLTLVNAAKEIIKGNVKLSPTQLRRLRPYEKTLRELVTSKSIKNRKKSLQTGGFIGVLLKPLLHLVGGALLNGLGGNGGRA